MSDLKHRIKEMRGWFYVEVWAYEKAGFLWRKKKYNWHLASLYGGCYNRGAVIDKIAEFATIEEARNHIKKMTTPITYHEAV